MSWVSSMGMGGGWQEAAGGGGGGWRKGPWTAEEDKLLTEYVRLHGEGRWNSVSRLTGLKRNGKSCRLRWVNYLRPDLKRGQITPHEENIILELHARWGNRWSTIARSLPGRTDNEIKNYWRTHFKNKTKIPPPATSKSRILKQQHFQQQQLLQQQQQHQVQLNQAAIKRIMSILDETDHNRVPYVPPPQDNRVGPTCHTSLSGSTNMLSVSEAPPNEDFLWDGLWNLDDFHGGTGFGVSCTASKACVQNLISPFC